MKLSVIGAGAYGTALGNLAAENGHEIKYYDPLKFPETEYPENSLKKVIADTDAILFVAPAKTAKETVRKIATKYPKIAKNTPLICASKGFLAETPFEPFENFSALGGAAFTKDIETKTPRLGQKITLTASDELSEQLFSTEFLVVEYTKDTLGILLCGALKNIYAIAAGINGISETDKNFFKKVYAELESLLKANGADKNTVKLSCGLPDLIVSIAGKSRNYLYGTSLRESTSSHSDVLVEGIYIANSLKNYPAFAIPEDAVIFKKTIESIKNATQ